MVVVTVVLATTIACMKPQVRTTLDHSLMDDDRGNGRAPAAWSLSARFFDLEGRGRPVVVRERLRQHARVKGLVVANLMMNNWDWKTSNNKIYEIRDRDSRESRRIYVVRDLGASLGKTSFPKLLDWFPMRGLGQGSRNDIDDFESQGFIKRVEGEQIDFYYRGIHQNVLDTVSRSDVVWTSRLMARLADTQWHDAFRAAGYPDDQARRFVAKIKTKVAEGLKLGEV
jgi:hypothetical protein